MLTSTSVQANKRLKHEWVSLWWTSRLAFNKFSTEWGSGIVIKRSLLPDIIKCTDESTWTEYLSWTWVSHPSKRCAQPNNSHRQAKSKLETWVKHSLAKEMEITRWMSDYKRKLIGIFQTKFEDKSSMEMSTFWDGVERTPKLDFVVWCFWWVKKLSDVRNF